MNKLFNKLKRPASAPFLVYFSKFGGKKCFSGKSGCVTHNFIRISSTMPKFRKNYCYNFKKTPGQPEGRKNGRAGRTYL